MIGLDPTKRKIKMSNVHKIWGERKRILLTFTNEIDLLYLKAGTFSSTHYHDNKVNRFVLISGKVRVETQYNKKDLQINEIFEVFPPTVHRFCVEEDSIMLEVAYVTNGEINSMDIHRDSQGGKIINGKEVTLDVMKEKGLFEL